MKNIKDELSRAWSKARSFPGEIQLLTPADLDASFAAQTVINLLQKTYINHGISQDPAKVEWEILNRTVEPFIVTRNDIPVACAALVHQDDGNVEIGRAVSIERGSGAGKIAMLSATQATNKSLVAEVRLAGEFASLPGSEATQQICFGLLELVPHAFIPAFGHGSNPFRREMFGFSSENIKLVDHRPILTATKTISNRSAIGDIGRLRITQEKPFRVAIRDDSGIETTSLVEECRRINAGFTLIPLEVTDRNLPLIHSLLNNQFIIAGQDKVRGKENKPILWLATVGKNTIIAPTQPSNILPQAMREEISQTAESFNQLSQGE